MWVKLKNHIVNLNKYTHLDFSELNTKMVFDVRGGKSIVIEGDNYILFRSHFIENKSIDCYLHITSNFDMTIFDLDKSYIMNKEDSQYEIAEGSKNKKGVC